MDKHQEAMESAKQENASYYVCSKEEVEKQSRRWCYLTSILVTLALITSLTTVITSLTSMESALTPTSTEPPQVSQIREEESHFIGHPRGPIIVTRSAWRAAPPSGILDINPLPVKMVVVLHTATEQCTNQWECSGLVRSMQRFHQESRNWFDVAYNFLIGGDGSVYWGRGFQFVAAHTKNFNNGTIGIGFIGTYYDTLPNEKQIDAFNKLIYMGVKEGKITEDYTLVAQCQLLVRSAPGLALAQNMTSWPHFDHSRPILCSSGMNGPP